MPTTAEDVSRPSDKTRRSVLRAACFQAVILLGLAGVAAVVHARFNPVSQSESPHEIELREISSTFGSEKILWVDARPAAVFAENHVPGAVWLADEAWEEGLPKFVDAWTPGQPIVVYCSSTQCGSSRAVAKRLVREFQATRVHFLKGGWDALQARKP
jgi:rhodanese-related sulfurtransferase